MKRLVIFIMIIVNINIFCFQKIGEVDWNRQNIIKGLQNSGYNIINEKSEGFLNEIDFIVDNKEQKILCFDDEIKYKEKLNEIKSNEVFEWKKSGMFPDRDYFIWKYFYEGDRYFLKSDEDKIIVVFYGDISDVIKIYNIIQKIINEANFQEYKDKNYNDIRWFDK